MKLSGKNVLVTGGNSGIGYEAVKLFVQDGARVVVTGRNLETLKNVEREFGDRVVAIQADVKDLKATKELMAKIKNEMGNLDVIYANAGIIKPTPLSQTSLEEFNDVIHTNLTSVFFLIGESLPLLNDNAAIVLNGSVVPKLGFAGQAAYVASKAGIIGLMTSMAAELSPRGIRINTIIPGATKTPIWGDNSVEDRIKYSVPMGRMGEAHEIAKAVVFLASPEASYIQATTLTVDGGATGIPAAAPIYHR